MKVGRKSIFSLSEQEYIRNNYRNVAYKDIANTLGYSERQIRGWVNNYCGRKNRTFDNRYFECIDTPEKAYFLGLIYADGWGSVHKRTGSELNSYEFGIQLQKNDGYLLDTLNMMLGGVHIISSKETNKIILNNKRPSHSESSVMRVYSKELVQSLLNHNITIDKTYSGQYPEVDDNLFIHFIRGYFDGDGCVSYDKRRKPVVHFTAYGISFLLYLQRKLADLYEIKSGVYEENDRKHRLIIFRDNDVARFFNVIYPNECDIRLLRKYEKYSNLLGLTA